MNHLATQSKDPSDPNLKARYQRFNELLWDGKLPDILVKWANLKGVGGIARVMMEVDESKSKPNPTRVRLGLEDKYSNRSMVPGSMHIKISSLYKRSELSVDQILIHEMIHVHFMITGHLGEGHGRFFSAELQRVGKILGFPIPVKDNLGDLEFSTAVKVKPYGVVLIKHDDGFKYAVYTASIVQNQLPSICARLESYAALYRKYGETHNNEQAYATVYLIADELWSEKAMRIPVQRKLGYGSYRMTDLALLDDLRANGIVLSEIL